MSAPRCFMRDFKRRQFERPSAKLERVLLCALYLYCGLFTLAHAIRYVIG